MRPTQPRQKKLFIALRHQATGESYDSLQSFRIGRSVALSLRCVTSNSHTTMIGYRLSYLPWGLVWDRKHIPTNCPRWKGSNYFNTKGFHSLVLIALVDADKKFIWFDIDTPWSSSDSHIFPYSDLRRKIEDNTTGFPQAKSLVDQGPQMEYFIVGDDAFLLRKWMMKPFSRRSMDLNETVFNYWLSSGRRVVKNTFGILASRFCVLQPAMQQEQSHYMYLPVSVFQPMSTYI